ncbi:hypothetical protein Scep_021890 [Stephania cephalantha]|uniref:Uncharacterized protein n=1 Tax=Stephania cephalantha TaxID=152367 RepID=A0AAP0I1R5_9MAGN
MATAASRAAKSARAEVGSQAAATRGERRCGTSSDRSILDEGCDSTTCDDAIRHDYRDLGNCLTVPSNCAISPPRLFFLSLSLSPPRFPLLFLLLHLLRHPPVLLPRDLRLPQQLLPLPGLLRRRLLHRRRRLLHRGDCISETLTFNDAASVDNIAHGCGHNIEGIFVGAAGVYKGVTTSQLDELAAETAAAMTASHPDYASVNVLVLVWVLGRWGVGVGGEVIPVAEAAVGSGGGGVIVDLGTAVTRLETAVRDRFRGVRGVAGGGRGGAVPHALRSESAGERERANVGLGFRWGKSVRLPARNYLVLKVPPLNMSIILK